MLRNIVFIFLIRFVDIYSRYVHHFSQIQVLLNVGVRYSFFRYKLMLELYEIDTKLTRDRMHYIPIIVRFSFLRYLILMFYKMLFNIHMFTLEKNPEICLLIF